MINLYPRKSEQKLEAVRLERDEAKRALREAKKRLEEATEEYTRCTDEYCSSRPPPPSLSSQEIALDG